MLKLHCLVKTVAPNRTCRCVISKYNFIIDLGFVFRETPMLRLDYFAMTFDHFSFR